MSYDFSIEIETGAGNWMSDKRYEMNYTSNVGPMFYRAIPDPIPGGGLYDGERLLENSHTRCGITALSGLKCSVALPHIQKAIEYFLANADDLQLLNPVNGWGTYHGALDILRKLRKGCEEHPNATVCINW